MGSFTAKQRCNRSADSAIPDLQEYDGVTLHIQDNGATRFAPIAQGGKFVFIDSSTTKLGIGTMLKVMRCPTTGNLVQI